MTRLVRTLTLALLSLALTAPSSANEPRRVAVLGADETLLDALRVALTPWDLAVEAAATGVPGDRLPAGSRDARTLARRSGTDAVVWISDNEDGAAVWVYDLEMDRIIARDLTRGPPFDEPHAAAVALTVKTFLRASMLAPRQERFGAVASVTPPPPGKGKPPVRIRLHAGAGGRLVSGPSETFEPRFTTGVTVWPGLAGGRFGVGLEAASGPGLAVDRPSFVGRFTGTAVSASLHARFDLAPRLRLEPGAGMSLHFTSLDGAAPMHDVTVQVSRTNPSVDASLLLAVGVTDNVELALTGGAQGILERQRYLVQGEPILELPSFEARFGLLLLASVF